MSRYGEVSTTAGMEYIHALMAEREDRPVKVENKTVGTFGIRTKEGHDIMIAWSINGMRKSKAHGVVGKVGKSTEYGKSLMTSMFKNW